MESSKTKPPERDITYKHRRKYKYDKKLGKYIRVRKTEVEDDGTTTLLPMKSNEMNVSVMVLHT